MRHDSLHCFSSIANASLSKTEPTTPLNLCREDAVMFLQEEESNVEDHHLQLRTTTLGTKDRSEIFDPSELKTPQTSLET